MSILGQVRGGGEEFNISASADRREIPHKTSAEIRILVTK